jgi:serine/threonine-protein kinase 24/25/MST4
VRHVSSRPATVGRANPNAPLTWENDDDQQPLPQSCTSSALSSNSNGSSTENTSSTLTAKGGDLPPVPAGATSSGFSSRYRDDHQATVRHGAAGGQQASAASALSSNSIANRLLHPEREPSDEYDDEFDDRYDDEVYVPREGVGSVVQGRHPEDDLPDTTMLDSVILPAIASVS